MLQLLVVVAFLLVFLMIGVQTGPGKRMIAGAVERYAVFDGATRVEVIGLGGFVPFDVTVEELRIEDTEGEWLSAEDVALSFRARALVARKLHIRNVSASWIEVARAPVLLEEPESEPWTLPEAPRLPDFIQLDSLSVERLVLGEALLGESGEFSVTAAYRPNEERAAQELTADLTRLDGDTTAAHVRVLGSADELEAAVSMTDSVYVPKLLEVEGPVLLEAHAAGPFTEWDGGVTMDLGERRLVDLTAALRGGEGTGFELSGYVELPEEIVGVDVIELAGGRFDVEVAGGVSEEGVLRLTTAHVESELVRVSAEGVTHLEDESINMETLVVYADGAELLGLEDQGAVPVEVYAGIDGVWSKPLVTLGVSLRDESALELNVVAELEEEIVLKTTGAITVPAVLEEAYSIPEDFGQLVVELESSYNQSTGKYRIANLRLQNQSVLVIGMLVSRPDEQMLDARGTLLLTDSEFLNGMIEAEFAVGGQLDLEVTNGGGVNSVEVTGGITKLQVDDVSVSPIVIGLTVDGLSIWENAAEGWSAALSVESGDVVIGERTLSPVTISVEAQREGNGVIQLGSARLEQGAAVIDVTGTADPSFESADLEVTANVSDITEYAALAEQEIHGRVGVTATAAYRANEEVLVSGNIATTVDDLSRVSDAVDEILKDGVRLNGLYAVGENAVSSSEFELTGSDFSIGGSGSYDWSESVANVATTILADLGALASAAGEIPLEGQAQAMVTAELQEERLDSTVDLLVDEADYDGRRIEGLRVSSLVSGELDALNMVTEIDASVDGQLVDGDLEIGVLTERIELAAVDVGAGVNRVRATGWWSPDGTDGDVAVTLDLPELNVIGEFVEQSVSGRGEGSVQVMSTNSSLEVHGGVTLLDMISGDVSADMLQLGASLKSVSEEPRGRLTVVANDARSGDFRAESFEAKAELRDVIEIGAAGNGTLPDDIPWEVLVEAGVDVEGESAVVSRLEGKLEEYPLSLEEAVRVSYAENAYSVNDLRLAFADGNIALTGSLRDDIVDAALGWETVPLTVAQLAGAPITAGTTTGQVALSGDMGAPVGTASVSLTNLRTRQTENLPRGGDVTLSATLSADRLDVNARAELSDASIVSVAGVVPRLVSEESMFALNENGAWSGMISGTVDLADVPRLLDEPDHVLSGTLNLDGALSGTPGDPEFAGSVIAEGASYENARMGTLLENGKLELCATHEQADLIHFSAEDGLGGTIEASGGFNLLDDGAYDYRAQVASKNIRLVHRDDITARATADLLISGGDSGGSVTGDLFIDEAHLIVRPSASESVNELDVVYVNDPRFAEESDTEAVEPEPPYVMDLDIDVRFPSQVFVQAQDVFTEWSGDLRIHGTTANTLVTGELAPVRGHITFLGRRFTLDDESLVSVNTETNSAPYLNLAATTRRTGIEATLRIRGSLEELEFSMSSNPPLPNEEILARVLFGRGVSELSPVQGIQLARAVAILSGRFEGVPFFSGPSRLPVVNTLDVTSGESGPSIAVGKYISDRVFVEAQPGTGSEESRVKVQIDATNNIAVESVVGSGNQTGLGVFFKYHY